MVIITACSRTRLGEPSWKTCPVECVDLLRRARIAFQAGRTLTEVFRLAQLEAVVRMLEEHECDFVDALGRDLHKVRGFILALDNNSLSSFKKEETGNVSAWFARILVAVLNPSATVWNGRVWTDNCQERGSSCHRQHQEVDAAAACGKEPGEIIVCCSVYKSLS